MPRRLLPILAAALLLSCGDDGTSSRTDPGIFAEMTETLAAAEDDFLDAHAAIYASAAAMMPDIAAALGLVPVPFAAAPVPCLPEGTGGQTYAFDGLMYIGVADPLVPNYTARFHLYQLGNDGLPQPNQMIGYIDITCADLLGPVTEVQVFADSAIISSTTLASQSANLTGTLRDPESDRSLIYLGNIDEEEALGIRFLLSDEMQAVYEFPFAAEGTRRLEVEIASAPAVNWGLRISLIVDGEGDVSDSGYTLYYPEGQSLDYDLAACIQSGTLDAPVFTQPSASCFAGADPMSITRGELDGLADSYTSLRRLWLHAAFATRICVALIPPAR